MDEVSTLHKRQLVHPISVFLFSDHQTYRLVYWTVILPLSVLADAPMKLDWVIQTNQMCIIQFPLLKWLVY